MPGQSHFLTVNQLRLHYLDFGNPDQPPLVCIHGLSGNAHNFDALAESLRDAYHVVSIDVRGRGESAWGPAADYNAPVYVADLAALLDTLAIRQVTLIGTSMGGIIAMGYAGGYPERVTKLILNDVGPEVEPAGLQRINDYFTDAPADFGDLAAVAAYYRENYPFLRDAAEAPLREFVQWAVKPGPSGRLVWRLDPAIRNTPRTGSAARPLDLWVPYARIAAPILVIRGAESDILARATAERMCMVIPGTTLAEIPGVGHAPTLLEAESLAAIRQFLLP